MELRQLSYVEAVVRHRHFTRAAEELHVAQSALSQQIRKLEAELGSALFERTSRRVVPTEAGEALAARARRVLGEVEAARGEVEQLRGLVRGQISIGALLPAGEVDVPGLLVRFSALHPGVDLALHAGTAADSIEGLRRDRIDLAFLLLSGESEPGGLEVQHLGCEELVIAYPDGKAPAAEKLTPRALRGKTLVTPREGSATKVGIEDWLGDSTPETRVSLQSGDPHLLRVLVSRGFGPAVLPRSSTEGPGPPLETRPLDPPIVLPVVLARREGRHLSPAATAFEQFVLAEAGAVTER